MKMTPASTRAPVGRGRRLGAALAVVAGALAGLPGPAAAEVTWLCSPDLSSDPCREASLDTTVFERGGAQRVERRDRPGARPVDCFYVYPTVSQQLSTNATKALDPEVVAIARYQAGRFSQECDVHAPVYRQLTLASIFTGTPAQRSAGFALAYGDVLEAWRAYRARSGPDRGVVFVSHSQGTRMLRKLLREEVDPDPAARRRVVSAILLGGNVVTRAGARTGGDFQHIPTCDDDATPGCVIAFSTFNAAPPAGARFGRPPAADDIGSGFPAGEGLEVACTNPAALAANTRAPLTTIQPSEPFPGVLGAGFLVTTLLGPPQARADTPYIRPADRYTGRCERVDGAHVLMVEGIGDARPLAPFPEPGWGLHLVDGNIALGDLVEVAGRQARTWLAARAEPARLRWAFSVRRVRDARGRSCARGGGRVAVAGADRGLVRRADIRVRGRRVALRTRAPYAATVRRTRLVRGLNRVEARVRLADGRTATIRRSLRVC